MPSNAAKKRIVLSASHASAIVEVMARNTRSNGSKSLGSALRDDFGLRYGCPWIWLGVEEYPRFGRSLKSRFVLRFLLGSGNLFRSVVCVGTEIVLITLSLTHGTRRKFQDFGGIWAHKETTRFLDEVGCHDPTGIVPRHFLLSTLRACPTRRDHPGMPYWHLWRDGLESPK